MMRYEVIDIRSVIFILISLFISTGMLSQIDKPDDLSTSKDKNSSEKSDLSINKPTLGEPNINMKMDDGICPSGVNCSELGGWCLRCQFNESCVYGQKVNVTCQPTPSQNCEGEKKFTRTMICRYCYQTDHWEHTCAQKANCNSVASPQVFYTTNCSVKSEILCMGQRKFSKRLRCNWTGGYRWSTALILSITLGGFGADRFYLGHWQEGIGKLFSFGGLGVWTLIDVILISLHYIGPADGSLYI